MGTRELCGRTKRHTRDKDSAGTEALSHLETLLRQGGATLPRARGCACAPRTGRSGDASVRGGGRDGRAGRCGRWARD